MVLRLLEALRADLPARRMWGNSFLVLMYHYFGPAGGAPDWLTVRADAFRRQMEHLARHYRPVALSRALRNVRDGARLPSNAVAITVDDVGTDFAEHAWPVIRDLDIPVCLAICPGFADPRLRRERLLGVTHSHVRRDPGLLRPLAEAIGVTPFEFESCFETVLGVDPDRLERGLVSTGIAPNGPGSLPGSVRLPVLSLDGLRELASSGLVEIASHTMTHSPCDRIPAEWMRWEVEQSRAFIVENFGSCPVFVYPGGGRPRPNAVGDRIVREAGYDAACTVQPGLVSARTDSASIGRIAIDGRQRFATFRIQVAGVTALASRARAIIRRPVNSN